jgi:hypothetical protein
MIVIATFLARGKQAAGHKATPQHEREREWQLVELHKDFSTGGHDFSAVARRLGVQRRMSGLPVRHTYRDFGCRAIWNY